MRELIWGKTLRSRLIRYNFFIIWVIAIFVSVCTYITASRKTLEVAKNSLQHHVESISYRYQLAYEEMINIVLNCTERKTFNLGEIGRGLTPGARKKGLDYAELIKDYCAISEYGDYIVKLSVFDDRGGMVQTGSSFGSTDDAKGILDGGWLDRELDKTMDSYELDLVDSPFFQHEGQVLPIARTLTGSRAVPGGWVVLCLSTDLFQDVLKDTSGGQEAVVVTSEGKRIASLYEPEDHREENDRVIRQLQQSGQDKGLLEMKIHGRNSLVAFEQYDRSGVMVYETITLDSLSNDRLMIIQTVIIMFAACLIFGFILSVLITNQIKKPIDRLVRHIGHVAAGNFTRDPDIEGEDEIGTVGKVVNDMSERIDTLMAERLEHEKEKGDLELKMLQAQINPHFLYNTLDMIYWLGIDNEAPDVAEAAKELGRFYMLSLGHGETIVSLKNELDHVAAYVNVQNMRFEDHFKLTIDVPEELYDYKIIKIILQPLVENAVNHGIRGVEWQGEIHLKVQDKGERIEIRVEDNGKGMTREQVGMILSGSHTTVDSDSTGIGLGNVIARLRLYYSTDQIFSINSKGTDQGTSVILTIPKKEEDGDVPDISG